MRPRTRKGVRNRTIVHAIWRKTTKENEATSKKTGQVFLLPDGLSDAARKIAETMLSNPWISARGAAEMPGLTQQGVQYHLARVPADFMFQLSESGMYELIANCDRFKTMKHSPSRMYAFTERRRALTSRRSRSRTPWTRSRWTVSRSTPTPNCDTAGDTFNFERRHKENCGKILTRECTCARLSSCLSLCVPRIIQDIPPKNHCFCYNIQHEKRFDITFCRSVRR